MESTPPSNSEALSIVREFVALERLRVESRERIELARMASEERRASDKSDAQQQRRENRLDAIYADLEHLVSTLYGVAVARDASANGASNDATEH